MPVEFRYAGSDEYSRISRFLSENWASNHIYTRDRDLFDWTFRRSGHWNEDGYSFALAEEGGELVGVLGGIPFSFNRFGEASAGIWIVNYVVREDYRRGPTAFQLLSTFRRPPFKAVIAFGFKPATLMLYKVLRAQVLPPIPRYFWVTPQGVERWRDVLQVAHPDWTADRASELLQAFCAPPLPETAVEAGDSLPEDWDRVDWRTIAAQTVGPARDADYLAWRYQKHPRFQYRVISVPEGPRTGLIIWRLETIAGAKQGGSGEPESIGRMLEFLPASYENARALMQAFSQQLAEAGALAADYYSYRGQTNVWLEEMGFRPARQHPDGASIPSRFQPLDGKNGDILGAMFVEQGTPVCSGDPACAWHWTKADSDQDRPN